MKKIVFALLIIVLIIIAYLILFPKKVYVVKIKNVDDYTPDIKLSVLLNEKEFSDYKYIKYDDENNVILCYSSNPTVNKYELEKEDKVVIVLNNDKEVIAEVVR